MPILFNTVTYKGLLQQDTPMLHTEGVDKAGECDDYELEFPGFMNLPLSWISALKSSRGVYLLTCPKTKEQYVGSATGQDGFWGRWQAYIQKCVSPLCAGVVS